MELERKNRELREACFNGKDTGSSASSRLNKTAGSYPQFDMEILKRGGTSSLDKLQHILDAVSYQDAHYPMSQALIQVK